MLMLKLMLKLKGSSYSEYFSEEDKVNSIFLKTNLGFCRLWRFSIAQDDLYGTTQCFSVVVLKLT